MAHNASPILACFCLMNDYKNLCENIQIAYFSVQVLIFKFIQYV